MQMIGLAGLSMQFPPADSTRLRNLSLDQASLSNRQETRVFVHSCSRFDLP